MVSKTKTLLFAAATLAASIGVQAADVPITAENWKLSDKGAEFATHKGRMSIKLNGGGAELTNKTFKNGIIEYDVSMKEARGFGGAYFRVQGDDAEYFYLRPHLSGMPDGNQYVPEFNGLSAWQMYHGNRYSTAVDYNFDDWIHVKLAIKDNKMDVFIDSEQPILHVDNLALGTGEGGIQLGGALQDFYYSNINVTYTDDVTLVGEAKPLKEEAPDLIKSFTVSTKPVSSVDVEAKFTLDPALLKNQEWTTLAVNEIGAANLARISGRTKDANTLFVKMTMNSDAAKTVFIKYGFSDRVTVFLNGKAVAYGNDTYVTRDYRYLGTVGLFDSLFLQLKQGDNEVIFAVTEGFGGWAFLASMANVPGVTLS